MSQTTKPEIDIGNNRKNMPSLTAVVNGLVHPVTYFSSSYRSGAYRDVGKEVVGHIMATGTSLSALGYAAQEYDIGGHIAIGLIATNCLDGVYRYAKSVYERAIEEQHK